MNCASSPPTAPRRRRHVAAAVCFALLLPAIRSEAADIAAGRRLAEQNCARCHAVGRAGPSIYPPAPPFRTLHERYPVENLTEALVEGIIVGHPEMPRFALTPRQAKDFIAYLKSLERP